MFKLMKLEMRKVKMEGYIRAALIANLVIIGILIIIVVASKNDGIVAFNNYNFAFLIVDSLVKVTFIVFASVLLARFIIDEYKNNTITLLFMYPIKRKKLFISKILIVLLFTFISIILSDIFIDCVMIIINNIYSFILDKLTISILIYNLINININALTSSCMALIPLYFGMKNKSVPATILSSLLIVVIVFSNNNDFSLSSISIIPVILALVGIFIVYLSIRNIEYVDVYK